MLQTADGLDRASCAPTWRSSSKLRPMPRSSGRFVLEESRGHWGPSPRLPETGARGEFLPPDLQGQARSRTDQDVPRDLDAATGQEPTHCRRLPRPARVHGLQADRPFRMGRAAHAADQGTGLRGSVPLHLAPPQAAVRTQEGCCPLPAAPPGAAPGAGRHRPCPHLRVRHPSCCSSIGSPPEAAPTDPEERLLVLPVGDHWPAQVEAHAAGGALGDSPQQGGILQTGDPVDR